MTATTSGRLLTVEEAAEEIDVPAATLVALRRGRPALVPAWPACRLPVRGPREVGRRERASNGSMSESCPAGFILAGASRFMVRQQ
jgi:hypothetical protein